MLSFYNLVLEIFSLSLFLFLIHSFIHSTSGKKISQIFWKIKFSKKNWNRKKNIKIIIIYFKLFFQITKQSKHRLFIQISQNRTIWITNRYCKRTMQSFEHSNLLFAGFIVFLQRYFLARIQFLSIVTRIHVVNFPSLVVL